MQKLKFKPVDYATLAYILLTLIYMAIGAAKLTGMAYHLSFRLLLVMLIFFFAYGDAHKRNFSKTYLFFRNFYPLFILGYFYKETGYLNNIFFDYFDPWFAGLEQKLWGKQPSLYFSQQFPQKWVSEIFHFGYFFYYLLTVGVSLIIYQTNRRYSERAIFVIVSSFLMYYLFFSLFPVMGPQFYFQGREAVAVDSYFFSRLVKVAQYIGEAKTGAFPSSHVGMSVVFLILTKKYSPKIFKTILLPVVILWFSTVYIKAHYLIDVLFGFPSGWLAYRLSDSLFTKLKQQKTGDK